VCAPGGAELPAHFGAVHGQVAAPVAGLARRVQGDVCRGGAGVDSDAGGAAAEDEELHGDGGASRELFAAGRLEGAFERVRGFYRLCCRKTCIFELL